MQEMQNQLEVTEIEGESGGGMVTVTLNGKGEMRKVQIDSKLIDANEKEILEDLLVAAHNDAKNKVEAHMQSEMKKLSGGLQLPPGLSLPFS